MLYFVFFCLGMGDFDSIRPNATWAGFLVAAPVDKVSRLCFCELLSICIRFSRFSRFIHSVAWIRTSFLSYGWIIFHCVDTQGLPGLPREISSLTELQDCEHWHDLAQLLQNPNPSLITDFPSPKYHPRCFGSSALLVWRSSTLGKTEFHSGWLCDTDPGSLGAQPQPLHLQEALTGGSPHRRGWEPYLYNQ